MSWGRRIDPDAGYRLNSTSIVAEADFSPRRLCGRRRRSRHLAYVVLGVLRDHARRGIGTRLLGALEA
jgi:GNAT superfamily N-acetyltransferase